MRILHTADWHIGQTLGGWSRESEHRAFFRQLLEIILANEIDALLVAGDVFDTINPSGEAQRLLYSAIAEFVRAAPKLQIVITAGNHDPAQRLEAPEAVLKELGVHVVGTLRRGSDDAIDLDHHLIGLRDRTGVIQAHVLAIPFLRVADLPNLGFSAQGDEEPAIVTAVRELHAELTTSALAHTGGKPLLAMGHLTCSGGLASEGAERRILIGGEHAVPPDVFPNDISYVALGHLHRAQSLDGGRVRYSGSPFPLSASEISYDHGVTLLELGEDLKSQHISIIRPVSMYRIPTSGSALFEDVAAELDRMTLTTATEVSSQPFIYVCVSADRPVAVLTAQLDALMERTAGRLAGTSIIRREADPVAVMPPKLADTTPEDVFIAAFLESNGVEPDSRHLAAFRDALSEV